MSRNLNTTAAIGAVSYHLPETKLTNFQIAEECGEWDAEKILAKTGVAVRSIAGEGECASDLGVAAAKSLFDQGLSSAEEIDFLLFCTQCPDYVMPPTACLVHYRLRLRAECGAVDLNLGCSGWVYGLAVAKSLIETGTAKNVLLITAETYSKFINRRDRSARTIFGDGAAATLIRGTDSEDELIGPFVFGTDGSGAPDIIIPAGGFRHPASPESAVEKCDQSGNWRSDNDFYMNGPEVFNFAIRAVPRAVRQLLQRWGRPITEVDQFIFHQASRFMLEHLRNKLKIPSDKFWLNLENLGNTVSSTIPIALESAKKTGVVRAGDNVAVVAFGVGYSWSAAMLKIT
jgi:3-oxoacyl-[acyl-carrier-protein] synthase-3